MLDDTVNPGKPRTRRSARNHHCLPILIPEPLHSRTRRTRARNSLREFLRHYQVINQREQFSELRIAVIF